MEAFGTPKPPPAPSPLSMPIKVSRPTFPRVPVFVQTLPQQRYDKMCLSRQNLRSLHCTSSFASELSALQSRLRKISVQYPGSTAKQLDSRSDTLQIKMAPYRWYQGLGNYKSVFQLTNPNEWNRILVRGTQFHLEEMYHMIQNQERINN